MMREKVVRHPFDIPCSIFIISFLPSSFPAGSPNDY